MRVLQSMEERPLYNSLIIDNYLKLIKKKYKDVDINDLLQYSGMEPYEVADQGSWFSQKQINRFHEKLSQATGYENISREAGRFAASPEALGITRQYVLGQADPAQVFAFIGKASTRMTRASTWESKKLASNKVEITVTPKEGVTEGQFQCENRLGILESIALVFSNSPPHIDHQECVFKNGSVCRYIVTWEKTRSAFLKRIRTYSLLFLSASCLITFFVNPTFLVYGLLPASVAGIFILALIIASLEKQELKNSLSEVFDSTNKLLDQINENYNNALMTHEFGQAISRHTNIDDILRNVIQILENRLDYDRGIILLANPSKSRLVFRAGFGYTDDQLDILEESRFRLDNPVSRGIFVVSFREQRPFLINDINDIKEDLSPRSLEILRNLGTQAFICCPIICEGKSLGVLAVDNLKSKRALVKSNMNLLMGFAPVIAASIRNEEEKKTLEAQLLVAQRLESIGTLAGGVAHDFNNLLMGIQGRASIMLMKKTPSERDYEHLKGIEEYVKSAAALTRQLLGFARGGKYEVKPTDLNTLLRKQNQMFGRTMKEIRIKEKLEENLWTTEVDQGQIEQVLMNLYVNAWQAMPTGGDLFVQTNNITIDEDYNELYKANPGRYVKISVTDTGIGMDKETQQRIFDPFFTTKEMGRGTGLGLASTYGIIKNHNGFINVYSEVGEGTSFNIYLPISEKLVVRTEQISDIVTKGTETILLVDDEGFILDVGKNLLDSLGYEVRIAQSGKEAIEHYNSNYNIIDIVILDMIMPDLGGGKVFDRLREINPNVKVLLSSGYSVDGQATEILNRGCNGFIQKPFTTNELSKTIRDILNGQ